MDGTLDGDRAQEPLKRDRPAESASRTLAGTVKRGNRETRARGHAAAGTPTPPPVAISIEPESGPDSERAGGYCKDAEQRGRRRKTTSVGKQASGQTPRERRLRLLRRALLVTGLVAGLVAVGWAARTGRLPLASLGSSGGLSASLAVDGTARSAVADAERAVEEVEESDTQTHVASFELPRSSGAEPAQDPPPNWRIRHEGHYPIKGGVLHAPSSFVPQADGTYDLIVHFHGNTWAVRESVEQANINAMVAIVNLGIGSAAYREAYEATGAWEDLLAQIDRGVKNRGVHHPRLRRIALSAWSAGYGAVGSILTFRSGEDPIDAILVEDGIHASWKEEDPTKMKPQVLRIFAAAAREAAAGNIFFTMTHSAIDPPTYAGTAAAARYLLREVGVTPNTGALFELPQHIDLECCEHAVNPRREKQLIPTSDTTVGSLHIRGFTGETKEHHMAHLLQMAATVLPELAKRWSKPTRPLQRKIEL